MWMNCSPSVVHQNRILSMEQARSTMVAMVPSMDLEQGVNSVESRWKMDLLLDSMFLFMVWKLLPMNWKIVLSEKWLLCIILFILMHARTFIRWMRYNWLLRKHRQLQTTMIMISTWREEVVIHHCIITFQQVQWISIQKWIGLWRHFLCPYRIGRERIQIICFFSFICAIKKNSLSIFQCCQEQWFIFMAILLLIIRCMAMEIVIKNMLHELFGLCKQNFTLVFFYNKCTCQRDVIQIQLSGSIFNYYSINLFLRQISINYTFICLHSALLLS